MVWNHPEGSMSIIYDYVDTCSLAALVECSGYLPDNVLSQVAADCLSGLTMLEKQGVNYNNLHAKDIHITTNNGRVQFRPQIEISISPNINSQKSELLT
jgi:hypothetical protein